MVDKNTLAPKEDLDPRAKREHSTRELEARTESWKPPSVLPVPDKQDGWVFRWIRVSMRGDSDNTNVSRRFREGWVSVKLEDHPELQLLSDIDNRFDGAAVVGGLMLCKMPVETHRAKSEYLSREAGDQMVGVDNSFMREEDARMPLLKTERRSRVTFGDGS